jgi:hypothetical protein
MVEIVGEAWDWNMNWGQALWLVLGYAQRNHVPEPDKPGMKSGRGSLSEFLSALSGVENVGQ